MDSPEADIVVVDEAHRARARTYDTILDTYPEAVVVGLTATPCRGDGKGLGNLFEELVETPNIGELVELGHLVPTTVYAPSIPDLTGVKVERGDYVESQLAQRMDDAQLVGDVVTHWHRLASDRQTVVFASGVAHSVHLRDEFRRTGVWAEHIDGSTPTEERDAILARLADGRVQVVTNCNVLTEGWDQPGVSACVLARPTKNMGLYRQMVGRVLRPAPGKSDALILDHAGATFEHGFAEEPVGWTLDTDKRADNPAQTARSQGDAPRLTTCPECGAVRKAGKPCTACAWQPKRKAEAPDVADGELARLDRDGKRKQPEWNKGAFYRQLLQIARERGYKDGWAAHKYREKFGNFPNFTKVPESPSPEVRAWVRSRQIAFAKAQQRQKEAV
jgi:superfamily II DNA or RNA helicase